MKGTILRSTLAGLSLACMLSLPALADSSAQPAASASPSGVPDHLGCPDHFDPGDKAGVRICRGPEGWRLVTTDPARTGAHEYTGVLTTNGKFTDVYLVRPENDDSATVDGDGRLNYDFKTFSGIDGVDFRVDGGAEVTLSLFLDGQQLPPERIWIGDKGRHPQADPFHLRAHPVEPSPRAAQPTTASAS